MSSETVQALLADLRRRDVHLGCRGDRLQVRAPCGIVSERDRDALRGHKAELRKRLELEACLLDLSLDDFAWQDHSIEIAVPWIEETIWFVPRVEHVDDLVRDGVHRGRVWTAGELMDLPVVPGLVQEDLVALSRLKLAFVGEVVAARCEASP